MAINMSRHSKIIMTDIPGFKEFNLWKGNYIDYTVQDGEVA